jgi:hypothetical protein
MDKHNRKRQYVEEKEAEQEDEENGTSTMGTGNGNDSKEQIKWKMAANEAKTIF